MTWFDIKWGGQTYVENLTGADEKRLVLLGIHGYATQAEAEAHPQTMNTIQAALGGAQALAGVSGSVTNIPTPGGVVGGAATGAAAGSSLLGLHLSWPGADTFLGRALKIVIGGVLLLAGILKMTGADKAAIPIAGAVAGKLPGF